MERSLITVIINNYNYEEYVEESIKSVLKQSYESIQLIVVDDGSTDNSLERIKKFDGISIVSKSNGGQMSCFNAAMKLIKGEIVFFLDSDDLYIDEDYIKTIVLEYQKYMDVDFIFVPMRMFGKVKEGSTMMRIYNGSINLGITRLITAIRAAWLGMPTSGISMKYTILEKILPYYPESDWRVRADDVLVMGASLVGARKRFVDQLSVGYRVHGENAHYGSNLGPIEFLEYKIKIRGMIDNILKKNGIKISYILENVGVEMWDGEKPEKLLRKYFMLSRNLEAKKIETFLRVFKSYIKICAKRKFK